MDFDDVLSKLKDINLDNYTLSNEVKLDFYKYYKQSVEGDCNKEKPWAICYKDFAKWEAWNSIKGMSSHEAKEEYVKCYYEFIS